MKQISRRQALQVGIGTSLLGFPNLQLKAEGPVDPYADAVLIDGDPPPIAPGSFTIAVVPDIQNYTDVRPEMAIAQTRWIVDNVQARNIVWVCQLGDLTNHNHPDEYKNAAAALKALDGKVPYSFVPGNHDYGEGGKCQDRTTLIPQFFPVSDFQNRETFGGTYDQEPGRMTNSFHRFSAGSRKFLVLALEFGPRHDVVRWAGEVVSKHADHEVILTTHAYLHSDGTRENFAEFGDSQPWNPHRYRVAKNSNQDVMDGEELWQNLVSKHENFILTLNGHVLEDGLGLLTSKTPAKRDIHQMVVNFQMRPNGGDAWLRLMEFQADGKTIEIVDYSPVRKQMNHSVQNRFRLTSSPVA